MKSCKPPLRLHRLTFNSSDTVTRFPGRESSPQHHASQLLQPYCTSRTQVTHVISSALTTTLSRYKYTALYNKRWNIKSSTSNKCKEKKTLFIKAFINYGFILFFFFYTIYKIKCFSAPKFIKSKPRMYFSPIPCLIAHKNMFFFSHGV